MPSLNFSLPIEYLSTRRAANVQLHRQSLLDLGAINNYKQVCFVNYLPHSPSSTRRLASFVQPSQRCQIPINLHKETTATVNIALGTRSVISAIESVSVRISSL